jgi:hypothetical protein
MVQDIASINTTKVNYELLCDAETLLGFTCVFPLLEIVQGFFKFAHLGVQFSYVTMFLPLRWLKQTYKPCIVILILEVHIISFFFLQ